MIDIYLHNLEKLRVEEISFGYEKNKELFNKASLEIPINSIVKIAGNTGKGKSCLLKIFAGILEPQKGNLFINDENIGELSFEEFLHYRLRIGYAFDIGGLLNNRTIRDNLMLPLLYHGLVAPDEAGHMVDEFLRQFDLEPSAKLRPSSVSGSQRKAACVARSLLLDPQVLILDEPTVGLSHYAKQKLTEQIELRRQLGSLKFLIFSSSDKSFLVDEITHIVTIRNQKIHIENLSDPSQSKAG